MQGTCMNAGRVRSSFPTAILAASSSKQGTCCASVLETQGVHDGRRRGEEERAEH